MTVEFQGHRIIIVDISGELAQHPQKRYGKRTGPVRSVMAHHTGGSTRLTGIEAPKATAQFVVNEDDPEAPGLQGRGWPGICYHFFVPFSPEMRDGKIVVYRCAPDELRTYQAGRPWNDWCVSVGFQGTFASQFHVCGGEPSEAQTIAWRELVFYLLERYDLDPFELWPHAWAGKPSCPGKTITQWLRMHRAAGLALELNEVLPIVLGAEVPDEESDPSGLGLRRLIEKFQRGVIVTDWDGVRVRPLKIDGVYGPATESFLRRALRERGAL